MLNTAFQVPKAVNEPISEYRPGSAETEALLATYREMYNSHLEVPQYIGSKVIKSGNTHNITPPHDHQHVIGSYHMGTTQDIHDAIDAAMAAKEQWANTSPQHRAAIFLKVAELVSGPYRNRLNAATMLGQSKNVHQTEIDAACEFIDFCRFNVEYMTKIYATQPNSNSKEWNQVDHRPLEGFTFAVTPFNFTAIAGNLPASMAMMGNVVVWKPSLSQLYSAQVLMEIFREAGVPDGVINMIITDPQETSDIVLSHKDFAGLHFTGSTFVFKQMWKTIGNNIEKFRTYPRIVGETGGKDFIWAHPSAADKAYEVVAAIVRGAFEFQGQKCSAASRIYLAESVWKAVEDKLKTEISTLKVGTPEDPSNFVTAVIHRGSFDKIKGYIDRAKEATDAEIFVGGTYDDSKGYFVQPTIIKTTNPHYESMEEEIFGPVATLYVYPDSQWESSLDTVDGTSDYALTGAIFSKDRYALDIALRKLRNAAGNTYINDKPTGAVVGRQPFGGARGSGTNDKAGSELNLIRWVSPRLIKEPLEPITDYRYPYLGE